MITDEQVKEAITKILADRASYKTSLNWAVNYCRQALVYSGNSLKTQCLYILGNISHWRHADAKEVRKTLRAYTKQKGSIHLLMVLVMMVIATCIGLTVYSILRNVKI